MICVDPLTLEMEDDSECGDDFKSGNYPPELCDKLSGFHIDLIAKKIKPKINELWEYVEDLELEASQCRFGYNSKGYREDLINSRN